MKTEDFATVSEKLTKIALDAGAFRAGVISTDEVRTDAGFRRMCEQNLCGNYGRSWMCPPDAGPIEELMAEVRTYSFILVYQTVGELEDSYDFEGMMEAGARHNQVVNRVRNAMKAEPLSKVLHLGAGGCRMCEVCAKKTGEPCRHPELAMSSLETYGINVSELAKAAGMKYINGQNTVTYFGAALFDV
jgi:predicted metal-binding protein